MNYKRDLSVELLRIFACLVVVGTHVKLTNYLIGNEVNKSQLFIGEFLGEGVTIFFYILGFFYFNNRDTIKLFKKVLYNTVIPALICLFVSQFLYLWIVGDTGLWSSIINTDIQTNTIVSNIANWTCGDIRLIPHLWFVFEYVKAILWFPLLKYLGGEQGKKPRRFVIGIGLINTLLVDVVKVVFEGNKELNGFTIVPSAVLMVLVGYEIYLHRDYFRGKAIALVGGLGLYLLMHSLHYFITVDFYQKKGVGPGLSWDSFLPILSAVGITMAMLSIDIKKESIGKVIAFVGQKTFVIYLVHWMVKTKLNSLGVSQWLYNKCSVGFQGVVGEMGYTLFMIALVFTISLIIAILIGLFSNGVSLLCKRLVKKI